MKSITTGYIFNMYDKTLNLQNKMVKLVQDGDVVDTSMLPRQFMDIERVYHFSSKNVVLDDLKLKRVVPIYCNGFKLPATIPFFIYNNNGRISVYVNLSNHMTENRNGEFKIDSQTLFVLLQGGSILAKCYEKHNKIMMNANILKYSSLMYAKLFTKVLNKMYSLNTIDNKEDLVMYLSSLFCLVNLMEKPLNQTTMQYALANCKSPASVPSALLSSQFKIEDFENLDTFIKALEKNVPMLKGLTTREFLDSYILSYMPPMMLALENYPIFLYNIFSIAVGAYINNGFTIDKICGKDIDKLFNAFFTLT